MDKLLRPIKAGVRAGMHVLAVVLNRLSGGRLSPNGVTIFGFLMHVPIAWLIATGHPIRAAVLLIIFGLFDTLDGELARIQGRSSTRGMLLDASTDRMKEVLLYIGIGYWFASGEHPATAAWAVAALGASVCVSYVKAKGEAAMSASGKAIPHHQLNRLFADGFLSFEVRMVIMLLGLLTGYLLWAVIFIAIFASLTALGRLQRIGRRL